MEIDPPASSSTSPVAYLDAQLASAPEELKPWWTKIKDQYERKCVTSLGHCYNKGANS